MTVDRVAGMALVLIGIITLWESRVFPLGSLIARARGYDLRYVEAPRA